MPAAVIPIGVKKRATWSLLEVARPGVATVPFGILLLEQDSGKLTFRLRDPACFEALEEDEMDVLDALPGDLRTKADELRGEDLLASLEDSLSHFLRISDRTAVALAGDAGRTLHRLFEEHVDSEVRPFITHLPLYGLRAAATKFGESMEVEQDEWILAPPNLRLTRDMFVAHVVGRSMEPLIQDGDLCVFRGPVTGSRYGRRLLIEQFGETDFAARYTVKRYARRGAMAEGEDRVERITLEPLNREFPAFELASDDFRVIGEFVQVLDS